MIPKCISNGYRKELQVFSKWSKICYASCPHIPAQKFACVPPGSGDLWDLSNNHLLLQQILSLFYFSCFHGWTAPIGSWSPLRGFSITLNHTIFGRTALNKWSAVVDTSTWQHTTLTRDLYPCTPWDSKPQSPASKRPQTYALDRAATRTDKGSVRWAKSAVRGQAYSV